MAKKFLFTETMAQSRIWPTTRSRMIAEGVDADLFEYYERRSQGLEPPPNADTWPRSEVDRERDRKIRRAQICNTRRIFRHVDYGTGSLQRREDNERGKLSKERQVQKPINLGYWSETDEERLLDLVQDCKMQDWLQIARLLKREEATCQEKYRELSSLGLYSLQTGPWSAQEEADLVRWMDEYGIQCWIRISHFLQRAPENCRMQYNEIRSVQLDDQEESHPADDLTIVKDLSVAYERAQEGRKRQRQDSLSIHAYDGTSEPSPKTRKITLEFDERMNCPDERGSQFDRADGRRRSIYQGCATPPVPNETSDESLILAEERKHRLCLMNPKVNTAVKKLFTKPRSYFWQAKSEEDHATRKRPGSTDLRRADVGSKIEEGADENSSS